MKKLIVCICLSFLVFIGFQTASAQSGTCGTNVKYTISGNTISFSRVDSSKAAEWWGDCQSVFRSDDTITNLEIAETIQAINGNSQGVILGMFSDCYYIESMNLAKLDVSNVTDMSYLFYGDNSLKNIVVSGWNTSRVTDMSYMFYGDNSLENIDVSGWNTSKVTDMSYMFYGCSALENLNVSKWITSNVTNMQEMFASCLALKNLDLSKWNTSRVTNMIGMFTACWSLDNLKVSGWNTVNVTSMSQMFYGCQALTSLDLNSWDTSSVTDMSSMFSGCIKLNNLDLSSWDTSNVTEMTGTFNYCNKLSTITLGKNTLKQNIFTSLPKYASKWHYILQSENAGSPLALNTIKTGNGLFAAYDYNKMAGTWIVSDKIMALPSDLVSIEDEAFKGCKFDTVIIPAGTEFIGEKAFANCENLVLIAIQSYITTIADDAFSGVTGLTIYCPFGSTAHTYAIKKGYNYFTN